MTLGRVAMLAGVALLVSVANIAATVLYMVVYGHVIDPGHEQKYYEDHVQLAAPYCSIIAGMPLMLAAGWWVSGWWRRELGTRPAWVVWGAYATIDLLFMLAAGLTLAMAGVVAVSLATKWAAALFGARLKLALHIKLDPATDGGGS